MYTVRYLIIKYATIKQKKYVVKHTSFKNRFNIKTIRLNISLILDTISLLTSLKQCIKLVK